MKHPGNLMPPKITSKTVAQLKDVRFRWNRRQTEALNIPSLTVAPGEQLFIAGPSGSGKSTLLSLLAGVITPQCGEVNLLGQRLDNLSGAERDQFRADHIGFIFHEFNLIPYLSTVDNVTLPCRFSHIRRKRAEQAGGSLNGEALRLLQHLELDDQEMQSRSVMELSVGQQQRVASARALIGSPELLIADEPTSALDSDMRSNFLELLFAECRERSTTLIFVSHDKSLQPRFSRALSMAEINRPSQAAVVPMKGKS